MAPPAGAQSQNGVLDRGDAVVTGFSGIKPADVAIPKGGNPLDEFFIDLDGASVQVQALGPAGQSPQGQLISTPSKLQIKARQVGQVFAVTLDDGRGGPVPNIYVGATSAYGLQIVLPDSDGDGAPERVTKGHPNAQWMAGQFGLDAGGGPGSIWRVDGQTGVVSLFATLPQNSGPGVGDVVFDRSARQFFASDLDNGLIYRISATGQVLESFDHGAAALPQNGLAPVADDGSQLDIKSMAFDSQNPGTWALTPPGRRVHGLAIREGRLYYAVAGQVWSVGVSSAGFAADARWELDAERLPGDGPVTDMLFDGQGRLYLAQRGAQRASYDYSVFAEPEVSNVVRYRREQPDDPTSKSVWVEEAEAYAIGLPAEHNHAEGGIALGYAHESDGTLRYGACGEMLWSTGQRLRPGTDDAEAAEADVHGLQGNNVTLVRPQNTPPQQAYFTDYDSLFGDAVKSGHIGDVEIWQPCQGAPDFASVPAPSGPLPFGFLPPGELPPDLPPEFPPDHEFQANLKLTKHATPKSCTPFFGGWLCKYTVRVTNTGPDNYFGPIVVRDWLPGTPAGAAMGLGPNPPWTCGIVGTLDYRCWRFGAFLAPGWSTELTAYAWVPKSYPKCHLTNAARIEWAPPGSIWNSDPTDDLDFASATIPSKECEPDGKKTDLKIYKEPIGDCFLHNGGIRCGYHVWVENQGPGAYNGNIVVEDTIPNGATAIMSGANWTTPCANVVSVYTCTHPGASLPNPGDATKPLIVRVDLPIALAKQLGCKVRNRAEITFAPGSSDQNTDPTNDKVSAVANIPAHLCQDKPPQSNLKIVKKSVNAPCLVTKDWCKTFEITVINTGPDPFNGVISVTDDVPAGTTVAAGGGGWTCMPMGTSVTCTTDAAVPLAKNPPSGDKVSFGVNVQGTAADAKALNCKLTNKAKIDSPLGAPQNTIAADDKDQATVDLPAQFCDTPVPQTNLKLEKGVDANGCLKGAGVHHCYYNVTVTNTGPGDYNDKIVVEENIPPGMTALFNGIGWDGCMPAGQDYTCTWNNPPLKSGEKTVLGVQVNVPDNLAKEFNCKIKNIAKISYAPGGSNQNTDPNDDEGIAIADVPQEICDSSVPRSNLKIEKTPALTLIAGVCKGNPDWCAGFRITVTNTGPNDFDGKITVTDIAPPGVAIQHIGGADWTCSGLTCETKNAVKLVKNPPASDSAWFTVVMSGTAAQAKAMNCKLTNKAKIDSPLGAPKNFNAADDHDQVTIDLPAELCVRPVPQTNLRLEKTVSEKGCTRGDNFECHYNVKVINAGPGNYNDKIVVNEFIPMGTTVTGDWNCVSGACTHGPVLLAPGGHVVLGVKIMVPYGLAKELNCKVTNGAKITHAPGGSASNTNPNDDVDTATANLPAEFCTGSSTVPACPPGYAWSGDRCQRPDPSCPRGWTPTPVKGQCCPPGKPWTGEQCGRDVPPPVRECPEGFRGTYPDCWKPEGRQCSRIARCLGGMTWSMETCACVCPEGRVMKGRQCGVDQPECPPGTVGKPPRCKTIQAECPPGTTGAPPRCKPVQVDCPRGMVGTPPNCRRPECPPGTRGVFPNCRKAVIDPPRQCPPGMVGRFPNCRRLEPPRQCAPGMVGRFPKCRPVVRVCPPGTFGRPPVCRRPALNLPGRDFGRPGIRLPGGGTRFPGAGTPPRSGPRSGGGQLPIR